MSDEESKTLTIFDLANKDYERERQKAISAFIRGKTPITEVKERPARGGATVKYVQTYYMTRQIALLTGFRWSTTYLEDRARPNWEKPIEVGVRIEVTIWDSNSNKYTQHAWGQKDVARYKYDDQKGNYKAGDIISIFDDLKAAESDAIKKALSYFGIANDIYGGKELEFFATEEDEESSIDVGGTEASRAFGKFLSEKHIPVSKALQILSVKSLADITDYKQAYETVKKEIEK